MLSPCRIICLGERARSARPTSARSDIEAPPETWEQGGASQKVCGGVLARLKRGHSSLPDHQTLFSPAETSFCVDRAHEIRRSRVLGRLTGLSEGEEEEGGRGEGEGGGIYMVCSFRVRWCCGAVRFWLFLGGRRGVSAHRGAVPRLAACATEKTSLSFGGPLALRLGYDRSVLLWRGTGETANLGVSTGIRMAVLARPRAAMSSLRADDSGALRAARGESRWDGNSRGLPGVLAGLGPRKIKWAVWSVGGAGEWGGLQLRH